MEEVLFAALAGAAAVSVAVAVAMHACLHVKLLQRHRRPRRLHAPDVSILKPLKGTDDGLEANLASLARQKYPGKLEILLAAADPADPALAVAQRVKRRFSDVDIRIVPGATGPGLNPKVANLIPLTEAARYDHLLVSDSNVRVNSDYLANTARELVDPQVGLVSNVLAGSGERTLGAALENLHLNTYIGAAVSCADLVFSHPCVIGKSMLMRREALESLGGWGSVADVLGEDYLLGQAFAQAGWGVVVSPQVITTVNQRWPVRRFVSRHLRWAQMRRWIAPGPYALEPLMNPVPWLLAVGWLGLLAPSWLGIEGGTWSSWAVSAIGIKIGSDVLLSLRLRGTVPRRLTPLWIPVKDTLALAIWALGWIVRTVQWRGNRWRIGPMSALSPLSAPLPFETGVEPAVSRHNAS